MGFKNLLAEIYLTAKCINGVTSRFTVAWAAVEIEKNVKHVQHAAFDEKHFSRSFLMRMNQTFIEEISNQRLTLEH